MLRYVIPLIFIMAVQIGFVFPSTAAADPGQSAAVPSYSVAKVQSRSAEMPTISRSNLPEQAKETLALIKKGGPFPYPRDGIVFGNREGLLPARPRGYFREYTVKTPGARDRGARRIVAGSAGEFYYTDDHYRTFRLIKE